MRADAKKSRDAEAKRSARQDGRKLMGVIADSMVAYAQPLLDETDGSIEQMQNAMSIAQMCWNLALLSAAEQEDMLNEMRPALKMDDVEFAGFRESVIAPMILRHHEMFPNMSGLHSKTTEPPAPRQTKYPGTGRNEPCPCNSGKKYKRCCGR
jgi:uncharacterized protein YecA (UPF0149 family)